MNVNGLDTAVKIQILTNQAFKNPFMCHLQEISLKHKDRPS